MSRGPVLLAVLIGVAAIAASGCGGGDDFEERTITMTESDEGDFSFVDVDPKAQNPQNPSISPGDEFVFSSKLSGDATGTLRVVCEFLEEAQNPEVDAHSFCSGSFDLEEGSVLAQGVTQTNGDIELPIVGGSGEFVGATGTLTSPQSGDDEPSINTLDLRLPKD